MTITLDKFIAGIPKAELHVHIEGTFEPELMFEISERNSVKLKYSSVEELRGAYNFNNLQEFLDLYYKGAEVLIYQQDFYDLTWAYLERISKQNVVHTEIFFDPQTHTERGINFDIVIKGIQNALDDAKDKFGITSRLIPCFLRHLDENSAIRTFKNALEYRKLIAGFGLDSSELGHPPSKFQSVFEMVRSEELLTFAHAGEEGSVRNVWDSLNLLKVTRIDHGIRSVDDNLLMQKLAETQTPLTVCPLSNLRLKVIKKMEDLPLLTFLKQNMLVTINSDDPAYFGGYINENYNAITQAFNLTKTDILTLAINSFKASLLNDKKKIYWIRILNEYFNANN